MSSLAAKQSLPRTCGSPFQDKFYEKLVSTILEARWHGNSDQKPSLNVGEVALLLDGGRHGTPNTYT